MSISSLLILCGVFGIITALSLLLSLRVWQRNKRLLSDLKGVRDDLIQQNRKAEYFRMACENANDGIIIQTLDAKTVWANPAYCGIFGIGEADLGAQNYLESARPADERLSDEDLETFRYDPNDPGYKRLQLRRNLRSDGNYFWNQYSVSFRRSTVGRDHAIIVCRDITEQVQYRLALEKAQRRLAYDATHDALTGAVNRAAFSEFSENALQSAQRTGARLCMIHVDLDEFKRVNDYHGHAAGDKVLRHVADAMSLALPEEAMVARIGGDEFVAVVPNMTNCTTLKNYLCELETAINRPVLLDNRMLTVTCSIGAAMSDQTTSSCESLLKNADFALYEAKKAGRRQSMIYDDKIRGQHQIHVSQCEDLTDAIEMDELSRVYQPIIEIGSGNVVGYETLIRWHHPTKGMLGPESLLPLAAQIGVLGEMDLVSMQHAIQQKRILDENGYGSLEIAFNASAELLGHPDFVNTLVRAAEFSHLDRASITIEVIETTPFGDIGEVSSNSAVLRDLRDAGFSVVLDDFGTGYAGLSHLAYLPVTGVKIDRSLVSQILSNDTSALIVRKVIELSNELGLTITAEGVEDRQTASELGIMGCTRLQGYLTGQSIAENQMLAHLREVTKRPREDESEISDFHQRPAGFLQPQPISHLPK